MRSRFLPFALVLLAGCGGGDDKSDGTAKDEQQARAVAQAYLKAVSNRDWKAVCATRATSEVKDFAKTAGSCEKAFAVILAKKPVGLFKTARAGAVRIEDDVAGIDVTQKDQTAKFLTLAAVREGDGWKLKDVPDEQVP